MVELQEHSPEWRRAYASEAPRLLACAAGRIDLVEHVGSTVVPGLVAKPIIDIAARAADAVDPHGLSEQLANLGYAAHSAGPKGHGVYVRRQGERRTHILHVFTAEQWPSCNQRLIRDKLLHDASARARYGELKRRIAAAEDGRAYTEAKRTLIQELLDEERAARGLPPVPAWQK